MRNKLISYYENELREFNHLSELFAHKYPESAGYLSVDPNNEAPHVSRLIQGVALLNARLKYKLDNEMPGVDNALLTLLYPHFEMPIPSAAIIQCLAKDGLTKQYTIPKNTVLETSPEDGDVCRFSTSYDNYILPVKVVDARLLHDKNFAPKPPPNVHAHCLLRLELRCIDKDMNFSQLNINQLRFFLNGASSLTQKIYEMLFNHTNMISVTTGTDIDNPVFINKSHLSPVGFAEEHDLFPNNKRSFNGYRLLTEFSVLPEKFLFFDITNLSSSLENCGNSLVLHFYFGSAQEDIDFTIGADNFMLGCAPVINLFPRAAEPISLTGKVSKYNITADAREPLHYTVCQVTNAVVSDTDGNVVEYVPFFGIQYSGNTNLCGYYHISRAQSHDKTEPHMDLKISLVNHDGSPLALDELILHLKTLCCNGPHVRKLFLGGNIPRLQFIDSASAVSHIKWVTTPTTYHPAIISTKTQAALISHLSLNHNSLLDQNGVGLKNLLTLYNFADNQIIKKGIQSIMQIDVRKVVHFLPDNLVTAAVQGNEITIILSNAEIPYSHLYLFLTIIHDFLTLYSSINSFVELVIVCYHRNTEIFRWRPKLGWKSVL